MKRAVVIGCSDNYTRYAVEALRKFQLVNQDYDGILLGSHFSEESKHLLTKTGLRCIEIDLRESFPSLEKRPYGTGYPIECFYHLYAYKVLPEYDYIVSIEPDVITQLPLFFEPFPYIAGVTDGNRIRDFHPIMTDLPRIRTAYPTASVEGDRVRGGLKIYNRKGCESIGLFERIVAIYKKSWEIGAPRCGDDSLFVLYQMIYPDTVTLLDRRVMVIGEAASYIDIVCFHDVSPSKWWNEVPSPTPTARFFKEQMQAFVSKP
jgi:hypothetical protein